MFFQKMQIVTVQLIKPKLVIFAVLATIAYFYYGAFYNYSFNLADEGSVALISEKLYKGERPFLDITLGYGILWYYPIVFLFKLFGVKFYIIRIYFLVLAFISSLFAYALLLRLTKKHVVAVCVGLLVLIFHGVTYLTYIPLLVISGAYVLFLFDVKTNKTIINHWLALFFNGVFLGFAFLIRGDIATIYTFIFLIYHSLSAAKLAIIECDPKKLIIVPVRFIGIIIIIAITAMPFALHAKVNGYYDGFIYQYFQFSEQLISVVHSRYFLPSQTSVTPSFGTLPTLALNDVGTLQTDALTDISKIQTDNLPAGTLWQKPAISSFFSKDGPHALLFVTYFPLVIFTIIWMYLGSDFFVRCFSTDKLADFISERTDLLILSLAAFSTFPQFFVWRPDMPHFSEFMPGFMTLMANFLFILWQRKNVSAGFITMPRTAFYFVCFFSIFFLVEFVSIYEEGLIIRKDRDFRLQMDKGIDVRLTRDEYDNITRLIAQVKEYSKPDDFVLCFPYCPGINFIADRRTFQNFLYADDSFLNSQPWWLEKMRLDIAAKKPKVIVIHDWAVNNTEVSRFRNWARPLYVEISKSYRLQDKFDPYEVFVLR